MSAASKRQTEDERNDLERLERVRKEEEAARLKAQATSNKEKESETIAKANAMGGIFGKGDPVGTGSVGGNNWSLAGRNLKALPKPSNEFKQAGKVVVEIRVNAGGNVISAKQIGGTISDKQTIQLALDAAKKAKFTEGEHDQIGTIIYTFKFN